MADARELAERMRQIALKDPIGVDISDYSDEWCAGFLAGQANALDQLIAAADGSYGGTYDALARVGDTPQDAQR